MRLRTRGALAAFPLVMALALTGCGGEGKEKGVASANGGKAAGGASAAPSLSRDEMGVKFAECMRKNGIQMEDPEPGKGVLLKADKGNAETMKKAQEACRQYNPQQNAAPGGDAKAEERGRKFAACMRENGVEKFPDPKPGQRGIIIDREAGEDPDMQAAQQKCQEVLGGGGIPGGGPK
ncbi:hypothetical protein [Actinomadura sp. 9N407]|uniref:hypothetical protein n=1 Tax=Actinomadura sp. 9N407 TaxID=3375154 RepID=UPI0037940090